MKWENMPRSHNVEIDCLGKRTKLDDGPEAQAALACQAALDELRTDKIDQLAASSTGLGVAGLDTSARRAAAENHVDKAFTRNVSSFMIKMGDDSEKGVVRKLVDHVFGADTYKGRLKLFKGYLDIPPLQELQPAPQARTGGQTKNN